MDVVEVVVGAACMTDACLALALELMVWAEFFKRDLLQGPRGRGADT